jgi:hypothetical protein
MAARGRRPVLDEGKKREILAILAVGGSRRVAASYVGCAVSTIQSTACRDAEFGQAIRHAEHQSELAYLKNIQTAAKKEQYWRAAAWALERRNPNEYGRRKPDVLTPEQVTFLLAQLAEIVLSEVPVASFRKKILKRLDALYSALRRSAKKEPADDGN